MWRLRQLIGEPVVNAALRDIVHEFSYRPNRTPTPAHVAAAPERHASAEFHPIIADVFDRITVHPIRAPAARTAKRPDGRYRVTLSGDFRKSYGNAKGEDTPAPLDRYVDYIDVGIYGAGGKLLSLTTHRIPDPRRELVVIVEGEPAMAVLDPLQALLDPDPADNRVATNRER
jgi:hypothetical protein